MAAKDNNRATPESLVQTQTAPQMDYSPGGATIKAFHESDAFVRGIMGPIGSGKSTACVLEILSRAAEQAPSPDGIRKTRWAIIRNSYPELKTTTIKTWSQWCPTTQGRLNQDSPITHHIKTRDMDLEVLFLALDRPDDQRKLLSLELTGAWINEAREIPKGIIDALTGRVGRYPAKIEGGATWSGIMMDTNPPDDQSWWYKLSEDKWPEGWRFFKQPAGDGPRAENIPNLPTNYYSRIKAGKDEDWIKVYVRGEYGFVTEGKPVYPMFRDRVHTAPEKLLPVPHSPLLLGMDFGLTPAAVIGQKLVDGRWLILDEITTDNCGVIRFAETLASYVKLNYPDHQVQAGWGDPAGNERTGNDEKTAFDILKHRMPTWNWRPAPSNLPEMRLEVVIAALNRLIDGNPGLTVSPKCALIRKGFAGGYHYKSVQTGNGAQWHETPVKNVYSHPHDALQYLLLGGGEHEVIMGKIRRPKSDQPQMARDIDYPIFGY